MGGFGKILDPAGIFGGEQAKQGGIVDKITNPSGEFVRRSKIAKKAVAPLGIFGEEGPPTASNTLLSD